MKTEKQVRCNNCLLPKASFTSVKSFPALEGSKRITRVAGATTLCAVCKEALQKAGVSMRQSTERTVAL